MLSRGQAWAEYIIILAVVIIMAGVAMYTAGAFAGSTKHVEERDSAAYWLTADVGITRYYVNSSLSQFVIKNNKNYRIILTSITSSGSGTLIAPGGASNITLEPGQTVQVNVSGLNCSSSQYSFPLDITYADAKYGVIYSFQGEKPLVGSCMGLSPMPVPPECSSNPDCGINSTACNSYCNGNLLCSFSSNPATCQRNCVSQKCKDCNASCGNASCASCGINTTTCPAAYCNGNQSCTYPLNASCNIPCSGGNCTGCTTTCTATCTNCSMGQTCQNGQCITVPTCGTDCTFGGNGICNASCSGSCLNFRPVCDAQSLNAQRCSNSTGGAAGSLSNYTICCNGAIASAPGCYQKTPTTVGWCGDAECDAAQGETYSSCPSDCCNSDCTGKIVGGGSDNTCHQQCSPYCAGFQTVCNNQNKNTKVCSDITHNVTCCNSVSVCPSGGTCQSGNCLAPYCGDAVCNGGETQTTCCSDCGCPTNRVCCDCGAGCRCRTISSCRYCEVC